jgi:protein ImuB
LHRGFDGVLAAVRDAIGRPVRIGSAPTRFIALAAARTARPRRPRLISTDLERREFLAKAPVSWLALYPETAGTGSGRRATGKANMQTLAATLQKLGIETLGEFAVLRRAEVAERFGITGLTARDLVYGEEPPLRPRRPAERLAERIDLIDDAAGLAGMGYDDDGTQNASAGSMSGDLEQALVLLIERLLARPERRNRTLRGVTLSAQFVEGGSWFTRAIMREPTAEAARIKLVVERKLLELPEPAAVLELSVDGFGPLDHESATLFGKDSSHERARRLKHAAEQARQAAGSPQSVARVVKLDEDSRLPERRAALSPGPVPLARPRPIEPRVDDDGRPILIPPRRRIGRRTNFKSRGIPVAHERERWIVEDRWWTGSPVRRHYFELVLADGSNIVVFQDLASKRWFEQRA